MIPPALIAGNSLKYVLISRGVVIIIITISKTGLMTYCLLRGLFAQKKHLYETADILLSAAAVFLVKTPLNVASIRVS